MGLIDKYPGDFVYLLGCSCCYKSQDSTLALQAQNTLYPPVDIAVQQVFYRN